MSVIVRSLVVSGIGGARSVRLLFDQIHKLHKLVQISSIEVAQLLVAILVVHVALDVWRGRFILVAEYVITAWLLLSHKTRLLAFAISLLKERKQVFSHEDHLLLFRLYLPLIVAKSSILVSICANFLEQHGWNLATYLNRCLRERQHIFNSVEVRKHVSVQTAAVLLLDPFIMLEHVLHVAVKALHLFLVK